jgi:hypothetical protein
VVAECFRARLDLQAPPQDRRPVLHLLEHENFDEQAGGGEGAS